MITKIDACFIPATGAKVGPGLGVGWPGRGEGVGCGACVGMPCGKGVGLT